MRDQFVEFFDIFILKFRNSKIKKPYLFPMTYMWVEVMPVAQEDNI